jgi:hypothetical protein
MPDGIGTVSGLFRRFVGTRSIYTALTLTRPEWLASGSCTLIFPALPRFFRFAPNGTRAGFSHLKCAFCDFQNSEFSFSALFRIPIFPPVPFR